MSNSEHSSHHHVVPLKYYVGTFIALMVLTVITVSAAEVDLGAHHWNMVLALAIAGVKAALVCSFFMGLKWDKGFNALICVGAFLFLAIFIGFTAADIFTRKQTDVLESQTFGFKRPLPTRESHH